MKIALVSQEYPPETARGGIGTQTYVKAKGLAALGHKVFVISRSIDLERHEKMDGDICVIRIPGMEVQLPEMTEVVKWITHSVVVAQEMNSLHKRELLDIIDFPEWAAEGYVYLLNRTAWNTVPVVIQLHGPLVMFAYAMDWPGMETEFYKTGTHMESTSVQLADAIYSSSACSAQWISSHYHPSSPIITVIHTGVDTNTFVPQPNLKDERPVIVFVGKIVPNKGVEELVDACVELVKIFPQLQLRLFGSGEASFINKLHQKALLPDGTSFLEMKGYIHKADLPAELAKATVFAAPSWYEGGPGFVYLEAMACGLPVVACSGSGINEIVTNEVNGLLVPPKNSKALEEALSKLLSNKTLAENMGVNARKFVLQESDSSDCVKKLESFYAEVIINHAQKRVII